MQKVKFVKIMIGSRRVVERHQALRNQLRASQISLLRVTHIERASRVVVFVKIMIALTDCLNFHKPWPKLALTDTNTG